MKAIINLLIISLFCLYPTKQFAQQIHQDKKALFLNPSVFIAKDEEAQKKKQIDFLNTFFEAKWNYAEYKHLLFDTDDNLSDLANIYWEMHDWNNYKPTLLSLNRKTSNLTIAKVAFLKPEKEGFASLKVIYDFMIVQTKHGLKLTNVFNYRTKDWQKQVVGKIKYHAPLNHDFDRSLMEKMNVFNNHVANYFNVDPINLSYYVCEDLKQAMYIRGFYFELTMFYNGSNGGFAIPQQNTILSGNNTEYYPHELVHIYTNHHFKNINPIINEGIATFLGGSQGIKYKEQLNTLNSYVKKHDVDIRKELFNSGSAYAINDKISLKYSVGALLCDLAVRKCGKQGLITLLDSGKSNEDLMLTLESLFGITKSEFNGFIEKELDNY